MKNHCESLPGLRAKNHELKGIFLGYNPKGAIITDSDGKVYALKAAQYRYREDNISQNKEAYTSADLAEIIYDLNVPDTTHTQQLVKNNLEKINSAETLPSIGIEIEGALINYNHELIPVKLTTNSHPELMAFTLENATQPLKTHQLQTPQEVAVALAQTIITNQNIASSQKSQVLYTSVPECGRFEDGQVSDHPYLKKFAPLVIQDALQDWHNVPQEAIKIYQLFGINPKQYLQETNNLNWPVHAIHIHIGNLPQTEVGLIDPRPALLAGKLRQTLFTKIMSLSLFNSRFLYTVDTGLMDVRSIIKRLLSTTHNSQIPDTAAELINQAVFELQAGKIHSLSRFPAQGQHAEVRFRMDAYGTIESIEGAMNPDLRLILSWAFFNQLLNLIAYDAMLQTQGNEQKALLALKHQWGQLFCTLPSLGKNSSYALDLKFNYTGLSDNFKNAFQSLIPVIDYYAIKYPTFKVQTTILKKTINQIITPIQHQDLQKYFGIEKGSYNPNNLNQGIVSLYKTKPQQLKDYIDIQIQTSLYQAQALKHIRDSQDLLSFFGIF